MGRFSNLLSNRADVSNFVVLLSVSDFSSVYVFRIFDTPLVKKYEIDLIRSTILRGFVSIDLNVFHPEFFTLNWKISVDRNRIYFDRLIVDNNCFDKACVINLLFNRADVSDCIIFLFLFQIFRRSIALV